MRELKFVIVDDAVFMRLMLKNMIEEHEGFKVIGEGSDGREAIDLARELKPDIMTLDITMPVMNGTEALPKVLEASPDTKVIMVSAMGQQAAMIEAIQKGASDFVVKPFEKSKILAAIKNVSAI